MCYLLENQPYFPLNQWGSTLGIPFVAREENNFTPSLPSQKGLLKSLNHTIHHRKFLNRNDCWAQLLGPKEQWELETFTQQGPSPSFMLLWVISLQHYHCDFEAIYGHLFGLVNSGDSPFLCKRHLYFDIWLSRFCSGGSFVLSHLWDFLLILFCYLKLLGWIMFPKYDGIYLAKDQEGYAVHLIFYDYNYILLNIWKVSQCRFYFITLPPNCIMARILRRHIRMRKNMDQIFSYKLVYNYHIKPEEWVNEVNSA